MVARACDFIVPWFMAVEGGWKARVETGKEGRWGEDGEDGGRIQSDTLVMFYHGLCVGERLLWYCTSVREAVKVTVPAEICTKARRGH